MELEFRYRSETQIFVCLLWEQFFRHVHNGIVQEWVLGIEEKQIKAEP